jgi:uncharacterized protein YhaN
VKIESLTLERYGHFTDRELSFRPDAALHVVLGANEAGKTSALSAISDLLFGFAGRTDYDFQHDSKTLRVGAALRHSDGRVLSVRRRKGTKNTLIDAADQPLPDDMLAPFLAGLTRDGFSREFGLTAQALRQGGHDLLNAGGSLAETLAAGSAGMTALSQLRERLKTEADELFTPRKSASKPFYLAAERHDAAEKALRDAVVTREALEEAGKAVQEARQRRDALNADHAATGRNLARWQRTLRVRSKLARLQALRSARAELADLPDISAATFADWRAALAADAALSGELQALDAADAADTIEIAALAVDDTMLACGPAIDALRERLGAVRKAMDDLPRRREARRAAQESLDGFAQRLGLAGHVTLLEKLPTDPALARVRDLIDRIRRAEQAQRDAEEKQARARRDLENFATDDSGVHAMSDPEPLRQRLEALADIPTHADRLRRDASALAIEKTNLAAAAAALDPPGGAFERLASLPLPDHAVIAAHARAAELSDNEVRRLGDVLAGAEAALEAAGTELKRLSSDGAVSTRADLLSAREQRNADLARLRDALDGERAERSARLIDLETASHAIDAITDRLLTDTERAAKREAAEERLAQSIKERDRIAVTLDGLQARRGDAERAWQSIWTASGIAPRTASEMLRWRERVDQILQRIARRDALQADLDALAATQDANRTGVVALLESMGRTPDRALPADILFREARSRLDELQKGWADTKARAVTRQRAERDLAEAEAALDQATRSLAEHHGAWPAALAPIGFSGSASTAEAEAALAIWQSVAVPKLGWESEGHRVDSIEADLAAFDADVAAVVQSAAPDLAGADSQQALSKLAERLAAARRAADACHRLREAGHRRSDSRKALALRRQALAAVLGEACNVLGAADTVALAAPMERIAALHALDGEQAGLQRELPEIADGFDENALRAEQDGLDLDALTGEIDRETIRQKQLLDEIAQTSALHHQKQRDYDVLTKGRDAGAAAAERAEAGAELVSVAERWLLRTAAARLASLAIERHRAMVQDPLIERASALFALATDAAYAGLKVDYGADDQPMLVAARASGETVPVPGLSEGTRDQLFLALRLALLERRGGEALPFIGDDLLTSFDEARTASSLGLLAAAGGARQIIVFTHHRHVADLAAAMPGHAIDILRL